jgi:outer membrane protein TolC
VIAADQFLPQLDLATQISAPSRPPRDFSNIQFNRDTRQTSLHFDYQYDQTINRNNYRKALINLERARRDYTEFEDRVRLEVRRAYRTLLQSRTSFELQQRSMEIAVRRTRLVALEQRAGQASARDMLDAQSDLLNAQNGLTSALVTYTTTRLQFLANLGMVRVQADGQADERTKPFLFDGIAKRYPYVGAATKTGPVATAGAAQNGT